MTTSEFISYCDAIKPVETQSDASFDIRSSLMASGENTMPYQMLAELKIGFIYLSIIDDSKDYSSYYDILEEVSMKFPASQDISSWSSKAWKDVIGYIKKKGINAHTNALCNENFHPKERKRAEAAKRLKKYDVIVNVENNDIVFQNINKAIDEIDRLYSVIGGVYFVNNLIGELHYEFEIQRFLTVQRQNKSLVSMGDDEIPYGYLLNLAVKYLDKPLKSTNPQRDYSTLIQLSTDYCLSVFNSQKNDIWSDISRVELETVSLMREFVIRDSIYNLPQAGVSFTSSWCQYVSRAISKDEKASLDLKNQLNSLVKVFKWVIRVSKNDKVVVLNKKSAKPLLNLPDAIRKNVVILVSNVNAGYFSIEDYKKVNFNRYPVIEVNGSYIIMPKPLCVWQWYEVLYNIIKSNSPDLTSKIGLILEAFVRDKLNSHGIISHSGKYNYVDKDNSKEISGETDFVIEAKAGDVLIEAKKKALSGNARSGDVFYIWGDFYDVIYSQMQCARTEYGVRTQQSLNLNENGTCYKYVWRPTYTPTSCTNDGIKKDKERIVAKVSLTLKAYGQMQDKMIFSKLIKVLTRRTLVAKFSLKDTEHNADDKKAINDSLRKINIALRKLSDFYEKMGCNILESFCRFYSLEQIYYIIRKSKSNDDFLKYIMGGFVSCGTLDFWKECLFIFNNKKTLCSH